MPAARVPAIVFPFHESARGAMRLLVSVADAEEAAAARAGGADIIDAKDPEAGPLGAVSLEVLAEIAAVVAGAGGSAARNPPYVPLANPHGSAARNPPHVRRRAGPAQRTRRTEPTRPLSAALGDARDEAAIAGAAAAYAAAGAVLVKVGFAGIADSGRVAALLRSAIDGTTAGSEGRSGTVAVAYADADRVGSLAPGALLDVAVAAGAAGVLLDTADKAGGGLRDLMSIEALRRWRERARRAGLLVALAGRLEPADLAYARAAGADIAGVRGAACEGGRTGRVAADRVRQLRMLCAGSAPHS